MSKLYFFFCMLFIVLQLQAQVYPIHKYSVEQGLAHSNVFRIMQDSKGFMWFSTNYGISFFNGKTFRNYTSANGLLSNVTMSVAELQNGEKLISTTGGINEIINDSIKSFKVAKGIMPKHVLYTKEYDEKIWVVALSQAYDLHCIENNVIKKIVVRNTKGEIANITKLEYTLKDGLIFISDKGLFAYTKEGGIWPFLPDIITQKISAFKQDKNGDYWIACEDRLVCVSNNKISYSLPFKFSEDVSDILIDSRNNVWVCIPQFGVILIRNKVASDITEKLGIKKILINNLYEDKEKNIWLATHGDGVYKISSLDILNYLPETNKLNVYAKSLLLTDNNNILAGSYGTVSRIFHDQLSAYHINMLKTTDYIYFLHIADHKLLIGIPTGVVTKDMRTGIEKLIPVIPGAISLMPVNDTLWVGGYQALGYIINNIYKQVNIPAIKDRRINCMIISSDAVKWLGTDNGLYKISKGSVIKEDLPTADNTQYINAVLEDGNKRLWIATEEGLVMKDKNVRRIFTDSNGLSHSKCNTLAEDAHHNIWVGTKNGLNRIDCRTLHITEHPTGLYPNEILSLLFDNTGDLIAGTVNGIAVIKELSNEITTRPPPLYISAVTVSGKKQAYPGNIILSSSDKTITIDFIALSYSYPDNVEYRYTENVLYQQWNTTKNTTIELSSLSPGKYDFIIEARVNGGTWSDPKHLYITLPTVFWKAWWFIAGIILISTVLFYYVVKWQLLRVTKKKNAELALQSTMIHLRQQALSALISPHFIFNCLNSIQYYLNKNNKDLAKQYLTQFGRLIRMTLEFAQEMYIPLNTELDRLNLYLKLEKLRCGNMLTYVINLDKNLENNDLIIPNMILQPYIENAIWHGIMPKDTPGHLRIEINRSNIDELKIIIEDDGLGILNKTKPESAGHISFGMTLIQKRLELFKKTSNENYGVIITDRSKIKPELSGTLIEVSLPILYKKKELSHFEAHSKDYNDISLNPL